MDSEYRPVGPTASEVSWSLVKAFLGGSVLSTVSILAVLMITGVQQGANPAISAPTNSAISAPTNGAISAPTSGAISAPAVSAISAPTNSPISAPNSPISAPNSPISAPAKSAVPAELFAATANSRDTVGSTPRTGLEVFIIPDNSNLPQPSEDELRSLLKPYQTQHIDNMLTAVRKHIRAPAAQAKKLRILDNGCNPNGIQACYSASQGVAHECVNLFSSGLPADLQKRCPGVEYVALSGPGGLPFVKHTFQGVMSSAVMEHVHGLDTYVREMIRTLDVGGVGYFRWGPAYYSAWGHHAPGNHYIQPKYLPQPITDAKLGYDNQVREIVGAYSHLLMDPPELQRHVMEQLVFDPEEGTIVAAQVEKMMHYIYEKSDLNREPIDAYHEVFKTLQTEGVIDLVTDDYNCGNGFNTPAPDAKLQALLEKRHPVTKEFGMGFCTYVAVKTSDVPGTI